MKIHFLFLCFGMFLIQVDSIDPTVEFLFPPGFAESHVNRIKREATSSASSSPTDSEPSRTPAVDLTR